MNSKSELKRLCTQDPVGMAKKILELEQRVKVLTDALHSIDNACIECEGDDGELVFSVDSDTIHAMRDVIEQTPQQTAAQIERGHIEWMMKLPRMTGYFGGENVVAIPPLPKESEE